VANIESGILLIDKPAGLTSFAVVRRARRVLAVRKIGHLGTLDPFATGLLPLCLMEATKLVPFLMPEAKTYRAEVRLGEETTTQDLTGEVVASSDRLPAPEEVKEAAARLVGEIEQIPPMYSALHYQGQRLYRLARRGEVVQVKPRKVLIYRLEVEEVRGPAVTLTVECSQGTYIRTLAADLGAALGCGAHLTALRRLAVGPFLLEAALTLQALEEASPEELGRWIIPLRDCLPGLGQVRVSPEQARQLRQGRPLPGPEGDLTPGQLVRVLTAQELVAVARVRGAASQAWLYPVRVFSSSQQEAVGSETKSEPWTANYR
jgi:tRNA pseudouridine55 synthase